MDSNVTGTALNETKIALLVSLVLLVVTALLYAPVVGFQFLNWDDGIYVVNNATVWRAHHVGHCRRIPGATSRQLPPANTNLSHA